MPLGIYVRVVAKADKYLTHVKVLDNTRPAALRKEPVPSTVRLTSAIQTIYRVTSSPLVRE
jgi:hypothetical protein